MRGSVALLGLAVLLAAAGCGSKEDSTPVGGGSTFIAPLVRQWAGAYEKTEEGSAIPYHAVGSSTGVKSLVGKKYDFACTDAPLDDKQLAEVEGKLGPVVHVPLAAGGLVAAYNVPEVQNPLRLTGEILADVYLGKIKKWNDGRIAEFNKSEKLPDKEIIVVRRRDGSGTTFVWTDYLSKVSKEWASGPGRGNDVKWPVSHKDESGNGGVAEAVRDTPYAIGYVELAHAIRDSLSHAQVRNREGKFVPCTLATVTAATEQIAKHPERVDEHLRFSLTDVPGPNAYPICTATWLVAPLKLSADKRKRLAAFLIWATGEDGEAETTRLLYVKISGELKDKATEQIRRLRQGK